MIILTGRQLSVRRASSPDSYRQRATLPLLLSYLIMLHISGTADTPPHMMGARSGIAAAYHPFAA